MEKIAESNKLIEQNYTIGDNYIMLKEQESNSVDLIYSDILYATGRDFGEYKDLKAIKEDVYHHYMPRIKEMHRVLKETGSIYLQMDTAINHWIRCIMDEVFGYDNFQNELVWIYRSQGFNKKRWSKKHDVILFYTKSSKFTFNLEDVRVNEIGESTLKRWGKEIDKYGKIPTVKNNRTYWNSPYSPPRDWIDINTLPQAHFERNGYPTQKPKELIKQFVLASSNEGDMVCDYYMGSGTTLKVCADLNRNFMGIDINPNIVNYLNHPNNGR